MHKQQLIFQPTLPARGATPTVRDCGAGQLISTHAPRTGSDTRQIWVILFAQKNFNPRSPHGERPPRLTAVCRQEISTHAPRTGSDVNYYADLLATSVISTHAPRTGSDTEYVDEDGNIQKFQPTLPARGATVSICSTACGCDISTHAPRTGSDTKMVCPEIIICVFQPTLPARGATILYIA